MTAYCGVTGLRPTYGLVSRAGAPPLSWTMDKIGPMAHTAWDCATVLEAISGPDPRDRSTARTFRAAEVDDACRTVGSARLGFAAVDFEEVADARIRPALTAALSGLTDDGLLVGIQLVGRPFSEATLVAIGRAFQEATAWHLARPPMPSL